MKPQLIAIYGAGGFAREVAWLAQSCEGMYEVACFIDDNVALHGKLLNDIPIMGLDAARQQFPKATVVAGIGSPKTRQAVMEQAARAGLDFAVLIHSRVERSKWIEIGPGAVICAGNILTTNISLGCHVQINLGCTVGHDVRIGDYTTLSPGVHVSGWVWIGKRVFVGTGAVIVNGTHDAPIVIGDDAIVGAGACVTKSVPASATVVGVPARPLQRA